MQWCSCYLKRQTSSVKSKETTTRLLPADRHAAVTRKRNANDLASSKRLSKTSMRQGAQVGLLYTDQNTSCSKPAVKSNDGDEQFPKQFQEKWKKQNSLLSTGAPHCVVFAHRQLWCTRNTIWNAITQLDTLRSMHNMQGDKRATGLPILKQLYCDNKISSSKQVLPKTTWEHSSQTLYREVGSPKQTFAISQHAKRSWMQVPPFSGEMDADFEATKRIWSQNSGLQDATFPISADPFSFDVQDA